MESKAWDCTLSLPSLIVEHKVFVDGLLNVTSADLLHREWSAQRAARWNGAARDRCHADALLSVLAPQAGLVTVLDGSP